MDYIVTVSDRNEQKMIYFNPVVFSLLFEKSGRTPSNRNKRSNTQGILECR